MIGNSPWREIKELAMEPEIWSDAMIDHLTDEEKETLANLIEA